MESEGCDKPTSIGSSNLLAATAYCYIGQFCMLRDGKWSYLHDAGVPVGLCCVSEGQGATLILPSCYLNLEWLTRIRICGSEKPLSWWKQVWVRMLLLQAEGRAQTEGPGEGPGEGQVSASDPCTTRCWCCNLVTMWGDMELSYINCISK